MKVSVFKKWTAVPSVLAFSLFFGFVSPAAAAAGPGCGDPSSVQEQAPVGPGYVPSPDADPATQAAGKTDAEPAPQTAGETDARPGPQTAEETETDLPEGVRGESLGIFTTTGYCGCPLCSDGSGLTYSGTKPRANHTIAADLDVYPLGTKLMIDGVIYTVEDMGGHVSGNRVDIYYDDHDLAVAHGTKQQEVFLVEDAVPEEP